MVSIIITSRYRPERLARCIQSIYDNASWRAKFEVVVVVDDDQSTFDYFKDDGRIKLIQTVEHSDNIVATNLGVASSKYEYIIYMNDDMVVQTKGFIRKAVQHFNETFPDGYGLLAFRDGIQNGNQATVGMTTKSFIKKYLPEGKLYYSKFKHYFCDTLLTVIAHTKFKYAYCSDIFILHEHEINGYGTDKVYSDARPLWQHDEDIYKEELRKITGG